MKPRLSPAWWIEVLPRERIMLEVATHLVLLFAACVEGSSTFTVVGETPVTPPARARIVVRCRG